MSHATIYQAASDQHLNQRTIAAVNKEAMANATFGDTVFGRQVKQGSAPILMTMAYPVAVDTEAAYESAVLNNNPDPGGDPSVITDASITAAIQAHWPDDPPVA
jgi:hypothetical protein